MRETVFLVEADIEACQLAQRCLEEAGFSVRTFLTASGITASGITASVIEEARESRPSLLLVAAELPGGSGLDLCAHIRQDPWLAKTPIVVLNSDGSDTAREASLQAGADDCIAKPYTPRELLARAQSVLRRLGRSLPNQGAEPTDIVIDRAAMKLVVRGTEVVTTTLEFRLVDYLARHRGQVFTRDVLLDAVWGEMQFVTPRSVDACIRRVRGKIEPDRTRPTYLKTIRGMGYRFDAVAAWPSWAERCTCEACVPTLGPTRTTQAGMLRKRRAASQRGA
jgi:DNA-binding response OmpR family regulator